MSKAADILSQTTMNEERSTLDRLKEIRQMVDSGKTNTALSLLDQVIEDLIFGRPK